MGYILSTMEFTLSITGTTALLMHNAQLCNPLNVTAKAMKTVSGKRKKTDDDHLEMARLEFLGGLYLDPDIGPFIPGENIQRCLVDAARITRDGVKVTRGVFIASDVNPLAYKGPRTASELWADENFRLMSAAKVQQSRIMRCRPIFREWRTEATGILDTSILDFADFKKIARTAGQLIGLGDWRPRYGRFTVDVIEN